MVTEVSDFLRFVTVGTVEKNGGIHSPGRGAEQRGGARMATQYKIDQHNGRRIEDDRKKLEREHQIWTKTLDGGHLHKKSRQIEREQIERRIVQPSNVVIGVEETIVHAG